MARKKKTAQKKSADKRPIWKRPSVIGGLILICVGVFLAAVAFVPDQVGSIGTRIDQSFLDKLFGRASILPGLLCAALGIVLLLIRQKIKTTLGLICLSVPILVIVDTLFTQAAQPDEFTGDVPGAYLGNLLRMQITEYIGQAGLVMVMGIVFLLSVLLLVPRSILMRLAKGLWGISTSWIRSRKRARSTQSSRAGQTQESPLKQETPPAQQKASGPPRSQRDAGAEQRSEEIKPARLNFALYEKDFVKIPNGLFEHQTSFHTDLPAGTRRQEIIDAFAALNVEIDIGAIQRGPSFEQYEIIPGKAVRVAQIKSCVEDISLRIKQKINMGKKRGSSLVIEVPLADRQVVPCGFLLEDTADDDMQIPIAVGVDASFAPFSVDLVDMPHLLIAGTTGSGKSVFLKTLIASVMYHLTPDEARLVLVDPKRVEFGVFANSLFLACKTATDFEQVPPIFTALVQEMEERYELLEKNGVSDIKHYNAQVAPSQRRPYVVVVVDEFADLLMQEVPGFEDSIIRLAQKARASGIHLVLATQRPSADVIKGLIKTNIPGRIGLSVSSRIDSKIILDISGAENLTGNGDLICMCPAMRDGIRLQGAYITNKEIKRIMAKKS
jgi:DNA segregation ATPase FtsK/SpoIIIE, S-DNA-T family